MNLEDFGCMHGIVNCIIAHAALANHWDSTTVPGDCYTCCLAMLHKTKGS